jgi:hypothetical protein
LHPADKDSYRVSKYKKWENELDEVLNGTEYPVKLDVSKFVRRKNISINVYCYSEGNIVPLEITTFEKDKHIDLLYLKDKDKHHYCWIQNLEKLVRSQIKKHMKKICYVKCV